MTSLWAHFTHWLTKDFYTYEERVIVLEEARRLKMKNDLQEERIRKRREREEGRAKDFRTQAVWTVDYKQNNVAVRGQFYLEQTPDVAGKASRRVRPGPVVRKDNGAVVAGEGALTAFIRAQPDYIEYVLPWFEWNTETAAIKGAKRVKILKEK